jgi:putative phage-type endonuclease
MSSAANRLVVVEPAWRQDLERYVTRFASREAWLKARANGVGGSEAAIILGASKWGSPYQLWSEKAGLVPPDNTDNDVLRFGRVIEPHIANEYERLTGRQLVDLGDWAIRRHPEHAFMFCTSDRLIAPPDVVGGTPAPGGKRGPGILSIKAANVWRGVEWLEDEEAPLPYQVQLQHELACWGLEWGSFAVCIWGRGVRWLDVLRNDDFIREDVVACGEFWRRVETGEAPAVDGSEHTYEALRQLYPSDTGAAVILPDEATEWAAELDLLNARIKADTERKDEINNTIRALLGEASEGYVPGGPGWTYKLQGARPAGVIPAQPERVIPAEPERTVPACPGVRVLRRKGNGNGKRKKGK